MGGLRADPHNGGAEAALRGPFWLNRGDDSGPRKRMFVSVPSDTYMAMGHNEQIVAVIPSLDAVVVRLGWTPEAMDYDWNTYIAAIAAALEPGTAAKSDAVTRP